MKYPTTDPTALLQGGKFTDGDPLLAIPASPDRAAYQNMVFDEILSVINAAGITPSDDTTQLLQSINRLFKPNWIQPEVKGTGLAISGAGAPVMARISATDFAYADGGTDTLRRYTVNYSNFTVSQVGSSLSIPGIAYPALAYMGLGKVAFIDESSQLLTMYGWSSTVYAQLGNTLSVPIINPSMCALNDTDIVLYGVHPTLSKGVFYVFRFNGTDWSQVGNQYLMGSNPVYTAITALSSSKFVAQVGTNLQAFQFDGTDITSISSYGNLGTFSGEGTLTALSDTDVVQIDSWNEELRIYRLSGTNLSPVGGSITISIASGNSPALVAMNGTDVVYISSDTDTLIFYRWNFSYGSSPYVLS